MPLADSVRSSIPPGIRRRLRSAYSSVQMAVQPFSEASFRWIQERDDAEVGVLSTFPELNDHSAWLGLENIGYRVVRRFRPQVVVELGTHIGLSALAMGLALRDLGRGGRLFAVDTWQGDPHAGSYDDSVYQTFLRRRGQLGLESAIVPLRMLFDEAIDKVARPIDLLHIDGLHTWDAVTHDWETYKPLMRPGGIVMFHDVNTHFDDVRRFWAALSKDYPTFTVPHSNGLGILKLPK